MIIIAAVVAACNTYFTVSMPALPIAVAQSPNFRAQNVSKIKRAHKNRQKTARRFFTWELVESLND